MKTSVGRNAAGVRIPPRTQLPLRVHVRLATCRNLMMREMRRSVERWNLTLPQFDMLAELARSGDEGFTFVELSRLLLVTSGNLTGIVDRLEAEGLVARNPDQSDRRVIRIRLTPRGRQLTREILPKHAEDVHQVLSFMPRERLDLLSGLLGELREGLHQRAEQAAEARDVRARVEIT
jgi:DNA-binding MarR family transcriptional regulator